MLSCIHSALPMLGWLRCASYIVSRYSRLAVLPIGKQSIGTDTLQVKLTIGWSELLSASIRPYAMHGQEVLIHGLSNLHGLRPRLVQWRRAITCATDDADQHPGTMHSLLMLERRMRQCIKCRMTLAAGFEFSAMLVPDPCPTPPQKLSCAMLLLTR